MMEARERVRVACMAGLLMDCSQLRLAPSTTAIPDRIQISHYSLIKGVSAAHVIDELSGESRQLERLILFLIKHSASSSHTYKQCTHGERSQFSSSCEPPLCSCEGRQPLQTSDCCATPLIFWALKREGSRGTEEEDRGMDVEQGWREAGEGRERCSQCAARHLE